MLPHLNQLDAIRRISYLSGIHAYLQVDKVAWKGFKDCVNNVKSRANNDVSLETLFNVNLSKAFADSAVTSHYVRAS